jgi:hypothetical protein
MADGANLEREFSTYALQQAHPLVRALVRAWRGEQLASDLAKTTADDVRLMHDREAARHFADTMGLDLRMEEYLARLVTINGHRFLTRSYRLSVARRSRRPRRHLQGKYHAGQPCRCDRLSTAG